VVDRTPKRRRRWLKALAALALVLILGPVALAAVARTQLAREYAGREVAAVLHRELGMTAEIDEIDLDTDGLAVTASGIRLWHPEHGRFVRAAVLRIRPSWWALLRGELDLHAITIEHATVWLKVRDGRIENLPVLPDGGADEPSLDMPFNFLNVEQARLVIDADPFGDGELRNIDIHVNASDSAALRVRVSASGGSVNHAMGRDHLSKLEAAGVVKKDALEVDRLRLETPELQIALSKAELALPLGSRYRGRLELGLHLPQLLRWPHGVTLPPLEGDLRVKAEVEGKEKEATGTARVVIERGMAKQFGFGERVALNLRFDPSAMQFQASSQLIHNGGRVDLTGTLEFKEGMPLYANGRVHDVSFAKLMKTLSVSDDAIVDWTLAGGFELSGPTDPLELKGTLSMPTRDFKVLRHAWHAPPPERHILGVSSAKLNGGVLVRDDGIHLQDIDIELPSSRLKATVLLGFDNDLRVRAQGLDWSLADSSPLLQFALGGRGGFELTIDGTFSDPVIAGRMRAAQFAFGGFEFGDLETEFAVDPDLMGVHFGKMTARKNDSRYALEQGFLDFRNDAFRTGGQLAIERLELADFYRIFRYEGDERYEPYQGLASGTVGISYTLGYPGDSPNGTMVADLDLDIPKAQLDGYAFTDGYFAGQYKWLDHELGYKGAVLTFDRLFLRKGAGTVNLSGRMGLGGALDLVVLVDRLSVRDTEGLSERLPGLTGTLAVTGAIKGTAARPRADLDLSGVGLAFQGESLGDARAYVRLTDPEDPWIAEALAWDPKAPPAKERCAHARAGVARANWPADPPYRTPHGPEPRLDRPMAWVVCGNAWEGQLAVDLAIGRTRAYPLRGQLAFKDLDFGQLLPRRKGQMPVRGHASGLLALRGGGLNEPHTLEGELRLQALKVSQLDVELKNRGPIVARFDEGSFSVERAELASGSSRLTIAGGGSLARGLGLSVDGSVNLGLLASLAPHSVQQASGLVAVSFKVSGAVEQPQVYGQAVVRDAALAFAAFPEGAREVNGKITFSARRVLLEGFSAKVAGGRVNLHGSAELEGRGLGSYALQVEGDGLSLDPRDGIALRLSGRGELGWKKGDRLPVLDGRLRIDELVYTRPVKMDRTLGEMYGPARAELSGYDPEADLIAFDLALEHSRPLYIRNNLIDCELRLENDKLPFRLVGTDQRFGLIGHMSVRKGTIRFRDTLFRVRQGDIHFRDETRIDPNFDLRATTEVQRRNAQTNWRIQIHAFGNRDQFQFALSSDPYLTEDDIALLLAMGLTQSELAQVEAGALGSTAALEALTSVTGVEREVHRALPEIDDFQIASTYSEATNRTEPQLIIGKRIASNVRLSASTGIAQSRDFGAGLELQLNDKTSVQAAYNNQNGTSASQIGDVGVDLKWRLEFD
jgi:translocation and assembly module TamB